jgi:hypothetical protein
MTRFRTAAIVAALIGPVAVSACKQRRRQDRPCSRLASNRRTPQDVAAHKKEMASAWSETQDGGELYQALRDQVQGGQRLSWTTLPDWSGTTRGRCPRGSPSIRSTGRRMPTAKLTPEYQARMVKRVEDAKRGIEWDPISTCAPPGHPRWLTEPFLREFVVTPDQTWLINEMVNDIRRIYTDGRDHVPAADRYPLYNGDSIGFWEGRSS